MNKKIICILISTILVTVAIPAFGNTNLTIDNDSNKINIDILDNGKLEDSNGVTVLHLNGSNYEMGYQHGILLKDEIKENMRMISIWFEKKGYSYDVILEIWDVIKDYLPQVYKYEIQGMADALEVSFEQVAVYNSWPAVINHALATCCAASVWNSATQDSKLYHIRSLDILHPSLGIKDPETGKLFRENQILIVRNPDEAYASIYPGSAGSIFCWGGINEKAIAIGANTCLTYDSTFYGISAAFRMRMVLDYASSIDEAIDIINSNRTCGWNFIISDGNIPKGIVIEQTANLVYIGSWFDPVESIDPFWKIEHVVRRCPMFISPICSDTQKLRKHYDPSGIRGLVLFLFGKNLYFTVWAKYRALSKEFENQWGTLDLNSSMSLVRNVYLGKTDFLFRLTQKLSPYKALHQWAACPETGEMIVCFADKNNDTACKNPVHYFKLSDLL